MRGLTTFALLTSSTFAIIAIDVDDLSLDPAGHPYTSLAWLGRAPDPTFCPQFSTAPTPASLLPHFPTAEALFRCYAHFHNSTLQSKRKLYGVDVYSVDNECCGPFNHLVMQTTGGNSAFCTSVARGRLFLAEDPVAGNLCGSPRQRGHNKLATHISGKMLTHRALQTLVTPTERLLEAIRAILGPQRPYYTLIGLHVRKQRLPADANLAHWVYCYASWRKRLKPVKAILACDDPKACDEIAALFKNRREEILYTSSKDVVMHVGSQAIERHRVSLAQNVKGLVLAKEHIKRGVYTTFLDFFLLSRSDYVIGTGVSSWSIVREYGNIPKNRTVWLGGAGETPKWCLDGVEGAKDEL
eukprot:GEMP01061680.1.p1 GENE.GEMP01061680.1~~GEMP01061680.1.p1  ORF type:complete len:385 (+),score=61.47 GEMP01061680.1:90-1157(+)